MKKVSSFNRHILYSTNEIKKRMMEMCGIEIKKSKNYKTDRERKQYRRKLQYKIAKEAEIEESE